MRHQDRVMCGSAVTGDGTADAGSGCEAVGPGHLIAMPLGLGATTNVAVVAACGSPATGDNQPSATGSG